jgi:hypothetical protein
MPTRFATRKTRTDVENHHIAFRTKGVLHQTYDLNWSTPKGCNTGCWHYDIHTGKHIISIDTHAYDVIADKDVNRGVTDLYKLIHEHEAAHSLFTTPDLKRLADELKANKIPWRLQNLFEDVRIERRWWWAVRKNKHWRWRRWIKLPQATAAADLSPTQLLFQFKCESVGRSLPKSASVLRACPHFKKVWNYFARIVELSPSATTFDLIPILLDWLKDFPETGDNTIEAEGGLGTGDLKSAIEQAGGETTEVQGNGGGNPSPQGNEAPVHDPAHGEGAGSSTPVPDSFIPDEPRQAIRLAGMLSSAFKRKDDGAGPTANPSKKLNVRGLLRGNWSRPFIGRSSEDGGKPDIALIFDLSGSMHSQKAFVDREKRNLCRAADAGRVLIRTLSVLAKRGCLTGTVYASGINGIQRRWNLPITDPNAYLRLVGGQGDDGIPEALSPNPPAGAVSVFKEITEKTKLALIYTDGCFSSVLDRKPLHAKGLYTLGLCCTSLDRTPQLKAQFDHFISRESLNGLADALVRFLKTARF